MKNFNDFKNLYQLSKTLRFELKPVGKTLDFIQEKGLLNQDEERAESYKRVKKIIDEYHKVFIDECLKGTSIEEIDFFEQLYFKTIKEDVDKKALEALQKKFRKQIAERFTKTDAFKRLFGKELIKEDLAQIVQDESALNDIEDFKNFTTYFSGFHENRKNMYSPDEKSTAISYRLIHENLPKFLANKRLFDKIRQQHPDIIEQAKKAIEPHLFGLPLESMFTHEFFSQTLRQEDIGIYNLMIGGKAEDGNKIQGLNELINLYRQKHGLSKRDIPNLTILYKQILSDRESFSSILEKFEKPQEVLDAIKTFYIEGLKNWKNGDETVHVLERIKSHIAEFEHYDASKMFLKNDTSLTDLSQQLFGSWAVISDALKMAFYQKDPKLKPSEDNDAKFEKVKFYSIQEIESALKSYCVDIDDLKDKYSENMILKHFSAFKRKESELNLIENVEQYFLNASDLLSSEYPLNKSLISDDAGILKIKNFLDALMDIVHFVKPLRASGFEGEKDDAFYAEFLTYTDQLDELVPLYNKVRNYLTQKHYSVEKYKLNFENSYFLSGWIPNYDSKAGLLYQYEGNYYLAINDKKLKQDEVDFLKEKAPSRTAQRIVLDFQKPDNTNTPRMFIRSKGTSFAPAVSEFDLPVESIIDIYDNGMFKTEYRKTKPVEYKKSLVKLIDYFKLGFSKHNSYKHFDFRWKSTEQYNDIAEFYHDTIVSCYNINYEETNWDNLMQFVNQGKLYLFQIYNKDFSEFSKGRPNLHTMYWKALFSPENLKDVVYKLNGQAEIFFRKKSLIYNEETLQKGHHAEKLKDKFDYPIISKRRFAYDKFQFHVPITMNFKASGRDNINQNVLEFLKEVPENEIHFIGIDRGERHLLYLSMINAKGEILKQFTLNDIVNEYNNKEFRIDYHKLLATKEDERAAGRKDWKTIETIKELKEGYISQVVHIVAKMMVENKAVLLMEDLNFGFKRGRFKVEKQVYQKFEKMLIDKLNYYVDKTKTETEVGGVLNALQLASKFTSFKDMGKQSGFIFYVPAWNTSKIDPVTGFVNLLSTKYENVDKSKEFFGKFSDIRWNEQKQYFEFHVNNYSAFNPKAEDTRQNWVICSHGKRLETFRNPNQNNQWNTREVVLSEKFIELFKEFNINPKADLKAQILAQGDKKFFEGLYYCLKLTLQMRNSRTGTDEDYLVSPVSNENGEFFDSRKYANQVNPKLPKDADANGAYNIARKGLILLKKIKETDLSKKVDLRQNNKEWLNFAQK
jgi:hypothetical protein